MKQSATKCRFQVTGKNSTSGASKRLWLAAVVLAPSLLLAGHVHAAAVRTGLEPCLNYFTVGVSGCVPAKVTPTTVVTTTLVTSTGPQPAQPKPPETLDTKIDDFLENHGKPPREFVAFYLEPTAENAMKWISKYNELIDRNIQLTIAWQQAETLYKRELASGTSPSALVSSTLPPVPNFGVAVPGFTDNPNLANANYLGAQSMFIASPAPIPGIDPKTGAMAPMPLATVNALNPSGSLTGSALPSLPVLPSAAVPATSTPAATPMASTALNTDLTYYYSNVCPYCKRFNPELKKALAAQPGLSLTCVDLSPNEVGPQTAPEGLPCKWRLPDETELTVRGVRQTPTLLVKTPDGTPMRVSGYVDENRLQSYFAAAGLLLAPAAAPATPALPQ